MSFLRALALTASTSAVLCASVAAPTFATAQDGHPAVGAGDRGDSVPGRLLVRFATDVDPAGQKRLQDAQGARRVAEVRGLGIKVLEVPTGAEDRVATALMRSGKVELAERDGIAEGAAVPNDSHWAKQWGPVKTGSPAAWDIITGSSVVIIAVLDSGVDVKHPDLAGRTVAGYDFINNDANPADDQGHGTKSTGVLGAASNNATGVAGTCWTCALMPVKVLDSSNYGSWSAISNGIVWATDKGAKVISMSIYGKSGSSTLRNAVKYAYDRGVTVVAAAGNDASTALTYPASYPEVLSVAGTDSADKLYSWSQKGSWISLAAPGCTYSTARGGGYGSYCGTSAATPQVAGIAGLMLAANPTASRAEIAASLRSTAVAISPLAHGRVDAAAAVRAVRR